MSQASGPCARQVARRPSRAGGIARRMRRRHLGRPASRGGDVASSPADLATRRAADRPVPFTPSMMSHELYSNRNGFLDPGPGLAEPQEMPRNGRADQAALGAEPQARIGSTSARSMNSRLPPKWTRAPRPSRAMRARRPPSWPGHSTAGSSPTIRVSPSMPCKAHPACSRRAMPASLRRRGEQPQAAGGAFRRCPTIAAVPRFVAPLAVADPAGQIRLEAEGSCRGRIIREPRGTAGFGYDPLFLIPEYHKTFGELSPLVKHQLSHRSRAFAHLRPAWSG